MAIGHGAGGTTVGDVVLTFAGVTGLFGRDLAAQLRQHGGATAVGAGISIVRSSTLPRCQTRRLGPPCLRIPLHPQVLSSGLDRPEVAGLAWLKPPLTGG